jgi:hypothetical protein
MSRNRLPHNQIVLSLEDGREVSLIQNLPDGTGNASGKHRKTVEIWIEGQPEPIHHVNLTEAMVYLNAYVEQRWKWEINESEETLDPLLSTSEFSFNDKYPY